MVSLETNLYRHNTLIQNSKWYYVTLLTRRLRRQFIANRAQMSHFVRYPIDENNLKLPMHYSQSNYSTVLQKLSTRE